MHTSPLCQALCEVFFLHHFINPQSNHSFVNGKSCQLEGTDIDVTLQGGEVFCKALPGGAQSSLHCLPEVCPPRDALLWPRHVQSHRAKAAIGVKPIKKSQTVWKGCLSSSGVSGTPEWRGEKGLRLRNLHSGPITSGIWGNSFILLSIHQREGGTRFLGPFQLFTA